MTKYIPNRKVLIPLLQDLLNKYPPTLLSTSDDKNAILAFQELIGEYQGLLLFPLFLRIYLPHKTASQIADKILSPATLSQQRRKEPNRERSRERGLSNSNKMLADVERILFHPNQLTERYHYKIDKDKFHSLLRIAHKRRDAGKSIDHFFIDHQYEDNIRESIAYSLYAIYEVGIIFREELYKAYPDKTKIIKKMPETDEHYRDAQKLKVDTKGKQTKKDSIIKDAQEFRKYIMSGSTAGNPDRHFYEAKRFRYLTVLVAEINEFFKKVIIEPPKAASSLRRKSKDNYRFSVDDYINKAMSTTRPIHGVGIITLPSIKLSAKGNCAQT